MKFVILLSLFVLSAWGALQYNEKEYGEIILQVVPIMTRSENNPQVLVYDDRSTGSSRDGSFYRPQCTNGARPLGHYAQGNYGTPQTVALCVRPSSTANPSSPPLASPTGYGQTWNDRGSGGSFDGSFWAPNAPSGYRCLGHVSVRGYGAPGTGEVYCVRNDLTKEGVIGGLIWNDQGSGANWDGAFWAINVPSSISTVPSDRALFAPNTYFGVGNYNTPTQQVYVLNLVLPTYQESLPPVTPVLTSCAQPAAETSNLLDNSVWVPMTAISDPSTSFLWKIQNSPFYRVQRVSNYNLQLFQTNIGTVAQSLSKAITFGTTTEQSNTVSTETTLTIGFETGASFLGVGGKVTGSIAIALGYSSTTSISNFQQTTTTLTLNTPPNACGALWTQKDTLRFIRGDGSVMNNAVISFSSGVTNVVYGQYAF